MPLRAFRNNTQLASLFMGETGVSKIQDREGATKYSQEPTGKRRK